MRIQHRKYVVNFVVRKVKHFTVLQLSQKRTTHGTMSEFEGTITLCQAVLKVLNHLAIVRYLDEIGLVILKKDVS